MKEGSPKTLILSQENHYYTLQFHSTIIEEDVLMQMLCSVHEYEERYISLQQTDYIDETQLESEHAV